MQEAHQRIGKLLAGNHLEQAQGHLQALSPAAIHAPLWMALADRLATDGRWDQARQALLAASTHLPLHAPFLIALCERLIDMGEVVASRRCLALLEQAPSPPAELSRRLGVLRASLGEHRLARPLIERAVDGGLDDPQTLFLLATQRYFDGDLNGAEHVLRNSLARAPLQGDAMVLLCSLKRQESDELLAMVNAGKRVLDAQPDKPGAAFTSAAFEYARFKILDDLGRYAEAWPALEASNRKMAALLPYAKADTEALVKELRRIRPVESTHPAAPANPELPTPIFIVGIPRSGSTLLDRMLSAHSAIADAGELTDFSRLLRQLAGMAANGNLLDAVKRHEDIDPHELGRRYLEQTSWRADGKRFYIDKLPSNVLMLPFIRQALPAARIVHITRPAMDTCYSNYKAMFGNRTTFSYDQQTLAHYYRQYRELVDHWRTSWPNSMLEVAYTDLVSEPEAQIRRVLDWCGLPFEAACLQPERNTGVVATPSGAQVRAPIHQRAIGQWHPYKDGLQPLREALGELAAD